jgi:hypothetical protein
MVSFAPPPPPPVLLAKLRLWCSPSLQTAVQMAVSGHVTRHLLYVNGNVPFSCVFL